MRNANLTHEQVDAIRTALYSALNVQGALASGCRLPAWAGLDAEYHDAKIRKALASLDDAAPEELFPELPCTCPDCKGTGVAQ